MLQEDPSVAKICFDTAENELSEVFFKLWTILAILMSCLTHLLVMILIDEQK